MCILIPPAPPPPGRPDRGGWTRVMRRHVHVTKISIPAQISALSEVDLAETDENGNETNAETKTKTENGRQDCTFCGIGRRSCK